MGRTPNHKGAKEDMKLSIKDWQISPRGKILISRLLLIVSSFALVILVGSRFFTVRIWSEPSPSASAPIANECGKGWIKPHSGTPVCLKCGNGGDCCAHLDKITTVFVKVDESKTSGRIVDELEWHKNGGYHTFTLSWTPEARAAISCDFLFRGCDECGNYWLERIKGQ